MDWKSGALLGAPDDIVLLQATAAGRALVTYDLRTIPELLRNWPAAGQSHHGVIFIDQRTIQARDVGGFVRALALLAETHPDNWIDRVVFLRRATSSRQQE